MNVSSLTPQTLAAMIDSTFLKPNGTAEEIEKHCHEALRYGFAMVAVNPAEIENCVRLLAGCPARVGAAVGFPLGQNTPEVKEYEAKDAIQRGAGEIDMVINVRALQAGNLDLVADEIGRVGRACRGAGVISKVILETCYLNDDQKRSVCRIAMQEGMDFVKTSTGFGPAGATVVDIRLMRSVVGEKMGVKAAGGIRSLATAVEMLSAGANRLGTSAAGAIVDALIARQQRFPGGV